MRLVHEKREKLAGRQEILAVTEALSRTGLQGKERAVRLALVALLTGGHILLEDIPGLGKTTLALALSRALGLSFGRVQCTSDLLPSDITGLSVFDRGENRFTFVPGPIFHNIVLVDEINRAMPKTQSALLEAMEERRVTVEGKTYDIPAPFLVIATQNPLEQVGTFPLPESQLDRFMIRTGIGYPDAETEKAIIRGGSIRDRLREPDTHPSVPRGVVLDAQRSVMEDVYLSEKVTDYLFHIVAATREHPAVISGISTRGGISLAAAARASAFIEGRDFVIPEDVKEVVVPVAGHRLALRGETRCADKEELLLSILKTVPVPLA